MIQNINTILVDMPGTISAYTISNADMSYTIVLNARLNCERQLKAYQHAISHITNEDFEKSDIQSIEFHAHKLEVPKEIVSLPEDKYEKRIRQLQRERKKIQKSLKEKKKEIDLLTELYGPDFFEKAARYNWLYGESE